MSFQMVRYAIILQPRCIASSITASVTSRADQHARYFVRYGVAYLQTTVVIAFLVECTGGASMLLWLSHYVLNKHGFLCNV